MEEQSLKHMTHIINHVNVDSHLARRKNVKNLIILYLCLPSNDKIFTGLSAKAHLKCKGTEAFVLE